MNCSICQRTPASREETAIWFTLSDGRVICPACLPKSQEEAKHDPVNHPKHYTSHPSGVECITITRHMSFNIGNAIKYLWRAGMKDSEVQDLEKAVWYIKDEIKRIENETPNRAS